MKFYSKQGNLYIFLLRKEKRQYFLRILLKTERQGIRDLSKGLALLFLIDLSVEKDYFGCKICFFGMTHFQILSKSFRDTRLSPRKCTWWRVFYLTYAKRLWLQRIEKTNFKSICELQEWYECCCYQARFSWTAIFPFLMCWLEHSLFFKKSGS